VLGDDSKILIEFIGGCVSVTDAHNFDSLVPKMSKRTGFREVNLRRPTCIKSWDYVALDSGIDVE